LYGPIEEDTRPFVAIRSIAFEPAAMTFRLAFRDDTSGALTVTEATPEATRLTLRLDQPVAGDRPFAALRSLFVAPDKPDVTDTAWPGSDDPTPMLESGGTASASARFGRISRSRHNLSAPDLVFDAFTAIVPR